MKKGIAAVLTAAMVLSLAACGNKKTEETKPAGTTEAEETTGAASSEAVTLEYVSVFDLGDLSEYVELGGYKGISVSAQDTTVTDEEVEAELQSQVENATPLYEEVKEGTVKEGDVANIDFVGKIDGEAFDGGSGTDFNLTIGSGQFIPGFEEGLIGKNIGDTVVLNLTFPEDYSKTKPEFNGAAAEFTVTINYVQGEEIPQELNDEFVQRTTNGQYKTVEEYRAYLRTDLEETKAEDAVKAKVDEAWKQILDNATFKKEAEEVINYTHDNQMSQFESSLAMYGMDKESYLSSMGMTEEDLEAQLKDYCLQYSRTMLLVRAIIEAEDMDLTDEDYEDGLQRLSEANGISVDALKASYDEDMLKDILRQERVQEFIEANVVEKTE